MLAHYVVSIHSMWLVQETGGRTNNTTTAMDQVAIILNAIGGILEMVEADRERRAVLQEVGGKIRSIQTFLRNVNIANAHVGVQESMTTLVRLVEELSAEVRRVGECNAFVYAFRSATYKRDFDARFVTIMFHVDLLSRAVNLPPPVITVSPEVAQQMEAERLINENIQREAEALTQSQEGQRSDPSN